MELEDPSLRIQVREYVDREIDRAREHEREILAEKLRFIAQQFMTAEQARAIAEEVVKTRLESMNEFREEAVKDAATYVRRDLHERIEAMESKIGVAIQTQARGGGAVDLIRWLIPSLPTLIALIIAIAAFSKP